MYATTRSRILTIGIHCVERNGFRAAINRRCTRRPPITACSMLTFYWQIPVLANSTVVTCTDEFRYLQNPRHTLPSISITCKLNPLYCQNQLLANSAPPYIIYATRLEEETDFAQRPKEVRENCYMIQHDRRP